jgi:hypothetical protein
MLKSVKGKNTTKCSNGAGWDQVIEEAKERILKLEISIKVFSEKKERGEPWPGSSGNTLTRQSSRQAEDQQHSV